MPPSPSKTSKTKPKKDILSRIKIKPSNVDATQRASFAPLPELIAPKDRTEASNEGKKHLDITL